MQTDSDGSDLPDLSFQGGAEFGVNGRKIARVNPGGPDGGHEIGVVRPAGNDVDVEMFGDAGARGASQVETDVEAIWFEGFFEGLGHPIDQRPKIGRFLGRKGGEFIHLAIGANHEMAEVVRVAIQDGEGCLGAGEDKMSGIVGGLCDF